MKMVSSRYPQHSPPALFTLSQFQRLIPNLPGKAQLCVTAWETLAQSGLVILLSSCAPSGRLALRIPSWSDNSAAEAAASKLFCTTMPLTIFVQKLLSRRVGVQLDTSHIPGPENKTADALSRPPSSLSLVRVPPLGFSPEGSACAFLLAPHVRSSTLNVGMDFAERAAGGRWRVLSGLAVYHVGEVAVALMLWAQRLETSITLCKPPCQKVRDSLQCHFLVSEYRMMYLIISLDFEILHSVFDDRYVAVDACRTRRIRR